MGLLIGKGLVGSRYEMSAKAVRTFFASDQHVRAIRRELIEAAADPFEVAAQALADLDRYRRHAAELQHRLDVLTGR